MEAPPVPLTEGEKVSGILLLNAHAFGDLTFEAAEHPSADTVVENPYAAGVHLRSARCHEDLPRPPRHRRAVAILLLVAVTVGLRPDAGFLDALLLAGLIAVVTMALAFLTAAFGLLVRGVEAAGSFSFILLFAPYVSSAFVPVHTLPGWLHTVSSGLLFRRRH